MSKEGKKIQRCSKCKAVGYCSRYEYMQLYMYMYSGTYLKGPPLGPKLLAALERWSYYAGSTECKRVI